MKITSLLFYALVLLTAGVSFRWGSIVGLVFFIITLMAGTVVASHWALQ
jgi:hypothetical protein